ncbi:MAG: hypothetical protein K8S27_04125 [Candidatus Omnitrophica bacterium]|nr:hypothetical protein [Candidatus Omnitrophota bacterium]
MKLSPDKQAAAVNMRLGVLMVLSFYILDIVVYPAFKVPLLFIRLVAAAWLMCGYFVLYRIKDEQLYLISIFFLVPIAFSISLMCLVVGEGMASTYFVGNILVIMIGSCFLRVKPKILYFIAIGIVVQHFVLLAFIPFTFKDFMLNLFFLASASILSILVHHSIIKLTAEINSLSGLLPICMYCKKIRDGQGYWNQVERYIAERAEVDFSHSICEECMAKMERNEKIREERD